jgi:hypothetical protein
MIQTKPSLDARTRALVQKTSPEAFSALLGPPARQPSTGVTLAQLIREGRPFIRSVRGTWDCPLRMASLALGFHIPTGGLR